MGLPAKPVMFAANRSGAVHRRNGVSQEVVGVLTNRWRAPRQYRQERGDRQLSGFTASARPPEARPEASQAASASPAARSERRRQLLQLAQDGVSHYTSTAARSTRLKRPCGRPAASLGWRVSTPSRPPAPRQRLDRLDCPVERRPEVEQGLNHTVASPARIAVLIRSSRAVRSRACRRSSAPRSRSSRAVSSSTAIRRRVGLSWPRRERRRARSPAHSRMAPQCGPAAAYNARCSSCRADRSSPTVGSQWAGHGPSSTPNPVSERGHGMRQPRLELQRARQAEEVASQPGLNRSVAGPDPARLDLMALGWHSLSRPSTSKASHPIRPPAGQTSTAQVQDPSPDTAVVGKSVSGSGLRRSAAGVAAADRHDL